MTEFEQWWKDNWHLYKPDSQPKIYAYSKDAFLAGMEAQRKNDILDDLQIASQHSSVSFSINYCESDDSWYGSIHSIAPAENWIGKNRSKEVAMQELLDALTRISAIGGSQ